MNISNVKNMSSMFDGCKTELKIPFEFKSKI